MLVILLASALLVRIITVLPFYRLDKTISNDFDAALLSKDEIIKGRPLDIFIFLGSGGHTGEMLRILQNYKDTLLNKGNILHIGYSDNESLEKIKKLLPNEIKVSYYKFIKAREVNAGLFKSIGSILKTLITSFIHVLKIKLSMVNKPHLVLLNGPGTCCIISLWFKLLDIPMLFTSSNIIYIESLARINSLSLTGKILYWLADLFVVQWEDLKKTVAPRAQYFGILV